MGKRVLSISALIVVVIAIAFAVLQASIGVKWEGITDRYGVIHWPISFGKEAPLLEGGPPFDEQKLAELGFERPDNPKALGFTHVWKFHQFSDGEWELQDIIRVDLLGLTTLDSD